MNCSYLTLCSKLKFLFYIIAQKVLSEWNRHLERPRLPPDCTLVIQHPTYSPDHCSQGLYSAATQLGANGSSSPAVLRPTSKNAEWSWWETVKYLTVIKGARVIIAIKCHLNFLKISSQHISVKAWWFILHPLICRMSFVSPGRTLHQAY